MIKRIIVTKVIVVSIECTGKENTQFKKRGKRLEMRILTKFRT
jgi:hypothetical protein